MKNRIVATFIAAVAAVSLMGCNVTTTKTYTKTTTTTDADGNTTTTTTTTTNGETTTETTEGNTAEEDIAEEDIAEEEVVESTVATIAFENETDFDFAELYFSSGASDSWGDDILGSDAPLAVGEVITFTEAFTYSVDNTVWDIKAVDSEGNNVEFTGADMTTASDPEDIYILFEYDEEDQSYSAYIQ